LSERRALESRLQLYLAWAEVGAGCASALSAQRLRLARPVDTSESLNPSSGFLSLTRSNLRTIGEEYHEAWIFRSQRDGRISINDLPLPDSRNSTVTIEHGSRLQVRLRAAING